LPAFRPKVKFCEGKIGKFSTDRLLKALSDLGQIEDGGRRPFYSPIAEGGAPVAAK
jgi:hypothetical protein